MFNSKDSQALFIAGYDCGYERACKDWEEKIDAIKEEIENRSYGIANDSVIQGEIYERQAVLEIIDKHIGEED